MKKSIKQISDELIALKAVLEQTENKVGVNTVDSIIAAMQEYANQGSDAVGFAEFIMNNIVSFNCHTKKWLLADDSLKPAVPIKRNYTTAELYTIYQSKSK